MIHGSWSIERESCPNVAFGALLHSEMIQTDKSRFLHFPVIVY